MSGEARRPSSNTEPPSPRAIFIGMVAGFVATSIVNAIVTPVFTHAATIALLLERDAWDLVLTSSVGALWGALVSAIIWLHRRSHLRPFAAFPLLLHASIAVLVVRAVLGDAIEHQAATARDGQHVGTIATLMLLGIGLGIAVAHGIGVLVAKWWWARFPFITLALVGAALNAILFRDDFFESHSVGGWAAASAIGGASAMPLSRWLDRRPTLRNVALIAAFATWLSVLFPPSNALRLEIFRSPAALGAWAHASAVWQLPKLPKDAPLPPEIDPSWLGPADRSPVAPSEIHIVEGAPIVMLITIDAVRADVLLDDANDGLWPNLARMKQNGAFFTDARSPGSQTAVSISTLFSGRYFSELYWSKHGKGNSRFDYPADDPSPRFPALLGARGVRTMKVDAIKFLANDFGVATGFAEDRMLVDDRRHAFASEVIDPLIAKLRSAGPGPLFLYAHLMEPHAPYDRGTNTGSQFERYKAEIGAADRAIGRLVRTIDSAHLDKRVLLIVSADHGEAFGEHGTFEHTKTLYEELIRVPILVTGAAVVPRRIATPVGLIDLGPTILDVLGVETPGSFMGQSLVPLLAGDDAVLTRPVFAEGRLRRSLVVGDIKVISDTRRKVLEGFDLANDPGETKNLYDDDPEKVIPALHAMQLFFDARTCRRPAYTPVYKP